MLETEVGGARLALLPQRAACLIDEHCLLVADAHFGKAASFRSLGVPVPRGSTVQNLQALSEALAACGARRIVFLGDLLHAAQGRTPATLGALAAWRREHAHLDLLLVRGNHDARAGDPPPQLGVRVVDEPLRLGGLWLCHHPAERADGYVLAGHLHPCVMLDGRAHQRLRLPCFHFGARVGLLPAFGAFTGMHAMRAAVGERVYVVADGAVWPLPQPTLAS